MRMPTIHVLSVILFSAATAMAEYNREDYEEPAGASFSCFFNTEDEIYGMSLGDGTWLKNTPVFADYQIALFSHGAEDSWYSGMGLTIRLMPHWNFAPFIGAGGSYNYSFKRREENPIFYEENTETDQGDSYWGGHSEAGFRFWTKNRVKLLELSGRYTWSSLSGERDYWLVSISTGTGI